MQRWSQDAKREFVNDGPYGQYVRVREWCFRRCLKKTKYEQQLPMSPNLPVEVLDAKHQFMEPVDRSHAVDTMLDEAVAQAAPELEPEPEPEQQEPEMPEIRP